MRRLFINARFLSQPITGVQRYAQEMVIELDRQIAAGALPNLGSIELLCPKDSKTLALTALKCRQVGRLTGNSWEQLELPWYSRQGYLVNLANTAPLCKRQQSVVFHDAAVFAAPLGYKTTFRLWYKVLFSILSRCIQDRVTVSEFSAQELAHYLKLPANSFRVTLEGCQHFSRLVADNRILSEFPNEPFLLAVSSLNPNKNFSLIVEALASFKVPPVRLVLVGGAHKRIFGGQQTQWPSWVSHLGYLTDAELKALYQTALGFVFPSLYEGFGLPPLEAMTCGCAVLAANSASLPEVCADAVAWFDPLSVSSLAEQINRLVTDPKWQQQLQSAGLKRAELFNWSKAAQVFWLPILEQLK